MLIQQQIMECQLRKFRINPQTKARKTTQFHVFFTYKALFSNQSPVIWCLKLKLCSTIKQRLANTFTLAKWLTTAALFYCIQFNPGIYLAALFYQLGKKTAQPSKGFAPPRNYVWVSSQTNLLNQQKYDSDSWLITNTHTYATQANSAFHPSGVGKSSTGLFGCGQGGVCSLVSDGR